MSFKIRPYHPSDLSMLYRICLLTADSGKDAAGLFKDPDLPGHFYAAPYALFEPELCFVATNNNNPCGYILGTKDSQVFADKLEADWLPPLRLRYKIPDENEISADAAIIRRIHTGYIVKEELLEYPAHLHIDILPEGQGQGLGRKLMNTFIDKLKDLNVPSLHLEVGKRNTGAVKYYEKMCFHVIKEYEFSIAFGMNL